MKFTKLAAAITLALAVSAAQAATATNNFNVKITITGTCTASVFNGNTVSDVDFGTETARTISSQLTATNDAGTRLAVACSKNLPFAIGLLPANADVNGAGSMSNGTDTIAYQLRQPTAAFAPAYTVDWGNTAGTNDFASTGTGLANTLNIPVQATIAANLLDVSDGVYTESVTATLTY